MKSMPAPTQAESLKDKLDVGAIKSVKNRWELQRANDLRKKQIQEQLLLVKSRLKKVPDLQEEAARLDANKENEDSFYIQYQKNIEKKKIENPLKCINPKIQVGGLTKDLGKFRRNNVQELVYKTRGGELFEYIDNVYEITFGTRGKPIMRIKDGLAENIVLKSCEFNVDSEDAKLIKPQKLDLKCTLDDGELETFKGEVSNCTF